MGIFFKRKKEEPPKEAEKSELPELPELETGMRAEVLNMENEVIFVGRLEVLENARLKVTEVNEDSVPHVEYGTRIKIRGPKKANGFLTVFGTVFGSTDEAWMVGDLKTVQAFEKRQFYRQTLTLDATVVCMNGVFEPGRESTAKDNVQYPCYLRDISAGGAQFRSKQRFQEGDWVLIDAENPIPDGKPLAFTARVRRVIPGEDFYDYGCQFQGITEREEDQLLQIVLMLQQKERKRRRGVED